MKVVARGNAHVRLLIPVTVYRYAGLFTNLSERPITHIPIEVIRCRVVGNENAWSAGVVEIRPQHPEAIIASVVRDSRLLGYVCKSTITIVVVQNIWRSFETPRAALN